MSESRRTFLGDEGPIALDRQVNDPPTGRERETEVRAGKQVAGRFCGLRFEDAPRSAL